MPSLVSGEFNIHQYAINALLPIFHILITHIHICIWCCLYILLDVHCWLCLLLFFLDFIIFLYMLAFNNNNNSIASLNLSMISDVLLIVHSRSEHLQGHLIVWFGSGDWCIYFMFQYDYLACSCSLLGIYPTCSFLGIHLICSLPCVLYFPLCVYHH